jgi:thiol-disulfide isomerase/thioredoxin
MRKTVLIAVMFVLTACAQKAPSATPLPIKDTEIPSELAVTEQPGPEIETQSPAVSPSAAWLSIPLTNVRNDDTFTVADFSGKVVLVETFAMWCSNCKKQQGEVREFHTLIENHPDLVFVALDIDPNEVAADLKGYIEVNDFPWIYAVAPADLSRELAGLYGDQFLNPPSTPMLIIDRLGEVHPLPFGIKSADDLQSAVEPYLSAAN